MLNCSTSRLTRACWAQPHCSQGPVSRANWAGWHTRALSLCCTGEHEGDTKANGSQIQTAAWESSFSLRATALGCRQLSCFQLSLSGFRHTHGTTQVTMSGALKAHNAHEVCQNHLCLPLSCSLSKAVHGLPLGSCASGTLPLLLTKC